MKGVYTFNHKCLQKVFRKFLFLVLGLIFIEITRGPVRFDII